MRAAACLLVASALLCGCADGGQPELFVDLRTDYVPGAHFTTIRTVLEPTDGKGEMHTAEIDAAECSSSLLDEPCRVAELTELVAGEKRARVTLLDAMGRDVGSNAKLVRVDSSRVLVVPISSVPEPEEECDSDAQCEAPVECAEGRCVEGDCFAEPIEGFCDTGTCNPSEGCPDPSCDDGVACTVDSVVGGRCTNMPDDAACPTGQTCTESGCMPPDCDDGVECTVDSFMDGSCANTPDDAACPTGQICTGTGCVPPDCDDEVACTVDSFTDGSCENTPNDAACGEGETCTSSGCRCGTGGSCASDQYCYEGSCEPRPLFNQTPRCADVGEDHPVGGAALTSYTVTGRPGARVRKFNRQVSCTGAMAWEAVETCDDADPLVIEPDGDVTHEVHNTASTDCDQAFYGSIESWVVVDGIESNHVTTTIYNSTCSGDVGECPGGADDFCPSEPLGCTCPACM